jgi:hypothetical protein
MTNETYEQRQARLAKERKKKAEQDELMLMAYMAGRSGNGYAMLAASEMVG